MRRKYLKKYKFCVATLLLSLVLFAWVSGNLFPHSHVVNDRFVTHSHPFSQSRSHEHTSAELNFFTQLSLITFLVTVVGFASVNLNAYSVGYRVANSVKVVAFSGHIRLHRGPPFN